ncbi:hypothetical protein GOBAR_AA37111 [Gossypium barbadense]|uniref:Uncharacterized protein n=1 Tax=Gossypium barbadense TaxID=3634 RepID=A0A2P5RB96_GOSBA|nr:hypothetical protein GOBAR_DD18990 [Gossypium barbadense]PPR83594.1 hypothetical protein GOBAR_AA37111 [Gossypium barbadense]
MVLGNGDQRSQDERESDGGDVGSPASQGDPNHQHPFNQREEEGKRGASPVQSHVTEDKSVEEANRDAESSEILRSDDVFAVKVEDESGPKEDLETTLEEAYNFVSEATAYGNEDKLATVTSEEVLKLVENEAVGNVDSNSAVETANVDNLVKSGLYVPEELDHAAEVSANKSVSVVVEPGLKESEEKLLPSSNGVSQVELGENEGKNVSSSATSTAESSTVVENPQHLESHDHSEKQPLVASTPPVVQRTSLFSCCGLLDVLTGSGR